MVRAVWLCRRLFPALPYVGVIAGVCSVLGHIFPFYLHFRGGKGFASYLGMTAMLNWRFGVSFVVLAWTSAVLSTALSRHTLRSLLLPIATFPVFVVILSCTVLYSIVCPQRRWKPIEHGSDKP